MTVQIEIFGVALKCKYPKINLQKRYKSSKFLNYAKKKIPHQRHQIAGSIYFQKGVESAFS